MINIKGLYEIHITVDMENLFNLWKYVDEHPGTKLILAVSKEGSFKHQYMISKWKNGTYEQVLAKMRTIEEDMKSYDINLVRSKIESMAHNKGVPETEEEMTEYLKNTLVDSEIRSEQLVGKPYFEYHAKIDLNKKSIDDLETVLNGNYLTSNDKLGDDTYFNASVNICGSKKYLITIRIYNHGRTYSEKQKDIVLDYIKEQGYIIDIAIQQEFSVYDDNDSIDIGWLIY